MVRHPSFQCTSTLAINCAELGLGGSIGSRVVSVMDSGAEGSGSNRSRDAVG